VGPAGAQLGILIRKDFAKVGLSGDHRGCRAVQQSLQIDSQVAAVFFVEIGKFERLKTALRRPERKQHACLAAHCAFAEVEDHFDFDSLIQGFLKVQETSGDRKLMQLATSLLSVFQAHNGEDRAGQFHPWSPRAGFC